MRRVVDIEAQPAAWHIDLDLAGCKDERQRGKRPQVAVDDVQRGEGADPHGQPQPTRPATVGPGHQADREPWPPELDECAADYEDRGSRDQPRGSADLDSQAQSVATRSVAMMLRGHQPQPSPPSAMNGMVAMVPKIANRRAVRE